MMKQSIVLFPACGAGHINPMIELAKLFNNHGFSVTVLIIESPLSPSSSIATFLSRISAANPSISFHLLPKIPLPPPPPNSTFPIISMQLLYRLVTPHILHFLTPLSQNSHLRALIVDYLATDAIAAAVQLGIPGYFFCATSASNLIAFVLAPYLDDSKFNGASFKDLGDTPIEFPGLQPIPASHMVGPLMDRANPIYDGFICHLKRLPMGDGIIANTFEQLEPRAMKVLADGLSVPGAVMPPVYCVGPVTDDGEGGGSEEHECLTWLDAQPEGSVVFLCFGSRGALSPAQLKEVAVGLERSGVRFLWVVKSTPSSEDGAEPELEQLMPDGFLERTEGRGMVVKSWAPQTAVLRHRSVGGFVSHCGWNSTLEAIMAGVPMIAWPLYAEQRMNKVFLVEEAKLAVAMEGYDKGIMVVSAEEVERKVRLVMDQSEEAGKEIRKRAALMKEIAAAATKEGGSSHKAWMELMSLLKFEE